MSTNLKAVYAKNNSQWRIVYFPGNFWELQEFNKLPDGVDRARNQDWRARNSRMSHDDAMIALSGKDTPAKKAA